MFRFIRKLLEERCRVLFCRARYRRPTRFIQPRHVDKGEILGGRQRTSDFLHLAFNWCMIHV
jgi:hypothetical protein